MLTLKEYCQSALLVLQSIQAEVLANMNLLRSL